MLFGGIIVGHLAQRYGLVLNTQILHFIQEFGLILFVYTIGIQVGPGFSLLYVYLGLSSMPFAILIILLGSLVTAFIYHLFNVPLPIILGIFSGAVTNTPSLGAGQQILTDLNIDPAIISQMGMGYAMAYPMGICGILWSCGFIRVLFKINIEREAKHFNHQQNSTKRDTAYH